MTRTAWILAAISLVAAPANAQQWRGDVAQGNTIKVQGISGSIRAIASTDGFAHMEATISDPSRVRVDAVEHAGGVDICVVYLDSAGSAPEGSCRGGGGSNNTGRNNGGRNNNVRVDFVVRVPNGVRFSGGMVSGDVRVEGLRAEVNAASVSGNVTVHTTGFATSATSVSGDVVLGLPDGQGAEFRANTVSGPIDSDFPLMTSDGRFDAPVRLISRMPPNAITASIGSGGPELRATTVSGTISLRKR